MGTAKKKAKDQGQVIITNNQGLSFEELMKKALGTPLPESEKKKKAKKK